MKKIFSIFLVFLSIAVLCQNKSKNNSEVEGMPKDTVDANRDRSASVLGDIEKSNGKKAFLKYNPTKAGLYSAVLPGLGQFYNKKYWKIPIVLGAVGTGVAIAMYNDKQYRRYRTAFIASLNGLPNEFSGIQGIDSTVLGNAQDSAKRYRDYSIAITGLVYILNIVDAVVDAHLYEGRHDPDLSINPIIINDGSANGYARAGLSLNFKF